MMLVVGSLLKGNVQIEADEAKLCLMSAKYNLTKYASSVINLPWASL